MNPLRKLAGDTAVYGVSSIIGRLLNYLLVPLHTQVVSRGEYGVVTEVYALAAFLAIVYGFGLETAYFRYATKLPTKNTNIFGTALTFVTFLSLILSTLLVGFDTQIVRAMDYEGLESVIWIFSGILFLDAIQALPFAALRLERKTVTFAKARIAGIVTNIGVNLFFLLFCFQVYEGHFLPQLGDWVTTIYSPAYHLHYILLANLAGSAVSALWVSGYLIRAKWNLDWELLRPMLRFGYPLVFTGLAIVTNEMLSRLALKYWLPEGFYPGFSNQEILGIFGGVYKLSILMNLGNQAFRYSAEPFIFSQSAEKNSGKTFADLLKWYVIFGCLVWMGVTFNLPILKYFLSNEDYWTALNVVPLLLLGGLLTGINYNLSAWFKLRDMTYVGTWITVGGALLTIFGNYLFIPLYGYMGSAWVTVLVFFLMSLSTYLLGLKYNPFPYQIKKITLIILISSLFVSLYYWLPFPEITKVILLNVCGIVIVGVLWILHRRSLI